jgi:hypothetical protein
MKYLLLRLIAGIVPRYKYPALGHVEAFPNRLRQWGEAPYYVRIPIVEAGERTYLLLTPREFSGGRMRANRNNEDCPAPRGVIMRLLWPILRKLSYHRIAEKSGGAVTVA